MYGPGPDLTWLFRVFITLAVITSVLLLVNAAQFAVWCYNHKPHITWSNNE